MTTQDAGQEMVGKVLVGLYPSKYFYDTDWHMERRRVLVESVTQTNGFGPMVHGRDLDRGVDVTLGVSAVEGLELHEATPEVLFPELQADLVGDGSAKRFSVDDPRQQLARLWNAADNRKHVYPASSATCLASLACLSE